MSTPELQETRHAAILLARGLFLGFVAGLMWGLPGVHWLLWIIAALGIFPFIFGLSAIAIAALVTRNVIGRSLDLHGRTYLVYALHAIILIGFLAIMVAVFVTGEALIRTLT